MAESLEVDSFDGEHCKGVADFYLRVHFKVPMIRSYQGAFCTLKMSLIEDLQRYLEESVVGIFCFTTNSGG